MISTAVVQQDATIACLPKGAVMEPDLDKIDDMTLALMHLTTFDEEFGARSWKGHDWNALDRLHQKGFIGDPKSKAKSVFVTPEGKRRSEELFQRFFGKS
jgi:hypothetical protein